MGRWDDADARSLVRDSKKWYLWVGGVMMRVNSGNNGAGQPTNLIYATKIKNPLLY